MGMGKGAYLKKITSGTMKWKSIEVDEKLDGSSPPSVFIGSYGYPKVAVGPMLTPRIGDTFVMDSPEQWIGKYEQNDIIKFRLDLVRGKKEVGIKDLENKLVRNMQEISLASKSVESEVQFHYKPRGVTFNQDHQPYGPSAPLDKFEIGNTKWEQHLEKSYYDTDWKAADAIKELYKDGVAFSQMQKAFSTGTMGLGKNRKLVPTRWSITAVDTILANNLYHQVKYFDAIENYQVYEFSSLNNYYAVILTPTPWMYEWIEAFIHVLGREEMIFADQEYTQGKSEYSSVGGCYYSCKFAVLEALSKMKKQAGAIVLREAYEGYVPLGVFNVRENVKAAMKEKPKEFESYRAVLNYLSTKLRLPISKFTEQGVLIKEMLSSRQTTLTQIK
ncbi:Nre family DNA repair protein [Candidatus Micrarchaeota archaeon]|nr:Nre family DNA repair protein [Candidatus Micrarchaeota archaeon]MBU1681990.1 Nre family DNA repair protein [Candidatus Micrarchaeota archaeon]